MKISTSKPTDYLACWLVEVKLGLASMDEVKSAEAAMYISSLPTFADLCNCPILWGDSDLKSISGSMLGSLAVHRIKTASTYIDSLLRALKECGCHAYDGIDRDELLKTWLWAKSVMSSRAFDVPDLDVSLSSDHEATAEERMVPVLVPLADMLNHRFDWDPVPASCEWGLDPDGHFSIRCRRPVSAGEELSIRSDPCSPFKQNIK